MSEWICDYCGAEFPHSTNLGGHIASNHMEVQPESEVSKEELIEAIQSLAEQLGKAPTVREMTEKGKYSHKACMDEFGSWNAALRAAGCTPTHRYRIPEDELLAEITRLAEKFGRPPSCGEMNRHGAFSKDTYISRFGGWETALKRAGYSRPQSYQEGGKGIPYGPNWQAQRQRALERDGFECQTPWCNITQSEHLDRCGRGLHVHHVIPRWYFVTEEGQFEYKQANALSNLVTVCVEDHPRWDAVSPSRLDKQWADVSP